LINKFGGMTMAIKKIAAQQQATETIIGKGPTRTNPRCIISASTAARCRANIIRHSADVFPLRIDP
jgi:hypothetical protein